MNKGGDLFMNLIASSSESQPHQALRIDMRSTHPGPVSLKASLNHLLRVHAGDAVRGSCESTRFTYQRGDIDLFPAGTSDSWQEDDPSTFILLEFSPALLRAAGNDLPERSQLEPRHHFRDEQIEHIVWALEAERKAGFPSGMLYSESLGTALAVRLQGHTSPGAAFRGGLTKVQQRRVATYIEEHLDADLSLATLAAVAGISVSQLKLAFKRSMGMPVHRYVIDRRVHRAKALLVQGRLPANQIALESGFAHQSHMARWMRRLTGITPSQLTRGGDASAQ